MSGKEESVFVVLRAYYKHGEANVEIISGLSQIESYLMDEAEKYDSSFKFDEEFECYEEKIDALIEQVVGMGQRRIENQEGWGILSITELKVEAFKSQYTFN